MSRPDCYVASPLGFSDAGRFYYEKVLLPALTAVVAPVDLWAQVDDEDVARAREVGRFRAFWLGVGARNLALIDECPLLVAVLDGQEIDSGTAAEVGYAWGEV